MDKAERIVKAVFPHGHLKIWKQDTGRSVGIETWYELTVCVDGRNFSAVSFSEEVKEEMYPRDWPTENAKEIVRALVEELIDAVK